MKNKMVWKRLGAVSMSVMTAVGSLQMPVTTAQAACKDLTVLAFGADATGTQNAIVPAYYETKGQELLHSIVKWTNAENAYLQSTNNVKISYTGAQLAKYMETGVFSTNADINTEDTYVRCFSGSNYNYYVSDNMPMDLDPSSKRVYEGEYTDQASGVTYGYCVARIDIGEKEDVVHNGIGKKVGSLYQVVNLHLEKLPENFKGELTLPASISVKLPTLENGNPKYSGYTQYEVPCVEVADYGFYGNKAITSLNIPTTYQRICSFAFTKCTNLKNITFVVAENTDASVDGSSVHMIGDYVFAGTAITKCYLPKQWIKGVMDSKNSSKYATYSNGFLCNGSIEYTDACFMGVGVYQDCDGLTEVTIGGKNPYIPRNTFAGCKNMKNVKFDTSDHMENVVFDVSSFAGYRMDSTFPVGNKIEELHIPCNAVFGGFAFANTINLKKVTVDGILNNLDDMSGFYEGCYNSVFDNSAMEDFIINPNKIGTENATNESKQIKITSRFFENATKLKHVIFGTEETFDKKVSVEVEKEAFAKSGIQKLDFKCGPVVLQSGSLSKMNNLQEVVFDNKDRVEWHGEVFAATLDAGNYNAKLPLLKKVVFNTFGEGINKGTVTFSGEEICNGLNSSTKQSTSYAYFNGVQDADIYFGTNIGTIDGEAAKTFSVGTEKHGIGDVKNIYIQNPNTLFRTAKSEYLFGWEGRTDDKQITIYGIPTQQNNDVNDFSKAMKSQDSDTLKKVVYKEYIRAISIEKKEDAEFITTKGFDPDQIKVKVKTADGTIQELSYSENASYDGYQLSEDTKKQFAELATEENKYKNHSIDLTVLYIDERNAVTLKGVQVQGKKLAAFEAATKEGVSLVEGSEIVPEQFEVTKIIYNDGTESTDEKDCAAYEISLEDGTAKHTLPVLTTDTATGTAIVHMNCGGVKGTATVVIKKKSIVSFSAIQVGDLRDGDTLSKSDFNVSVQYDNGQINGNYLDYNFMPISVTEQTNSIQMITADGVERQVPVTVKASIPYRMTSSYVGGTAWAGSELDKVCFRVMMLYDTGKIRTLSADEFELFYETIQPGVNDVSVIYKKDPSFENIIRVTGVDKQDNNSDANSSTTIVITSGAIDGTPDVAMPEVSTTPGVMATPSNDSNVVTATVIVTPTENVQATKIPDTENVFATSSIGETVDNTVQATVIPAMTVKPTIAPATTAPVTLVTPDIANSMPATGKMNLSQVTVGVKESIKLSVNQAQIVSYTSSNSNIAMVDQTGKVVAKAVGVADIVAKDSNNNKYTCKVTVKNAPKMVTVSCKKKVIRAGKKAALKVKFNSGAYSHKLTFVSSKKAVATVSDKGIITAKKKGIAKITVKTYNNKKAIVKVIVK